MSPSVPCISSKNWRIGGASLEQVAGAGEHNDAILARGAQESGARWSKRRFPGRAVVPLFRVRVLGGDGDLLEAFALKGICNGHDVLVGDVQVSADEDAAFGKYVLALQL